jgi:hypothetical protein
MPLILKPPLGGLGVKTTFSTAQVRITKRVKSMTEIPEAVVQKVQISSSESLFLSLTLHY